VGAGGPLVSMLVAAAENDVIGRDAALPWHLPEDLRRFKALTMGKPMLMGRKTFDSIGRPLPGRRSLVLTRSTDWAHQGVTVVHSMPEALAAAADAEELVVIGGAQVYTLAMPYVQRIYLTRVHAQVSGDTHLPPCDTTTFREVSLEDHAADARHAYAMTFVVLERRA